MNVEHAKELSDRLRRRNLPREHSIAHLRHASAHNGILKEEVVQVLVNHAVHPVEELTLAAFFPNAALRSLLAEDADDLPEFGKPRLLDRRGEIGMRLPARRRRADELDHALVLPACNLRLDEVVPVRLVDDDGVRKLHDALLDALQLIARTRQYDEQEEVNHRAHGGLGLPDTDRLDDDDIVARRLTEQHRLAALARNAAECPARR